MKRSAAEVLEDARRLPASELNWLIGKLLQAGDGTSDGEVDEAWEAEVARRVAEIDSGAAVLIPLEDVLARMDGRIRTR